MPDEFHVYIMASERKTLYIGMTNHLERRVYEHKHGTRPGFTSRHAVTKLAHAERTGDPLSAIRREKQLKGWLRARKNALIEESNPHWEDLAAGWFIDDRGASSTAADPSLRSG